MSFREAVTRRLISLVTVVSFLEKNRLLATAILGATTILVRYWSRRRQTVLFTPSSFAKPLKLGGKEYAEDEYDFIVVGGGTGGCVLASRLSEDPSVRVLVLEAGQSFANHPFTRIPVGSLAFMHNSPHVFNFFTEPQANSGGRSLFWPRAKMLGGCTNMNAMIYQRGHPSDYDEWAKMQKGQEGASSWSYEQLSRYFWKFEKYIPHKSFPRVNTSLHNTQGVVNVGHYGYFSKAAALFVEACVAIGIPRSQDLNTAAGTMGVAPRMTYMDSAIRRVTAERSYLTSSVLARPNLTVVTEASATRILFEQGPDAPRAIGVEFADTKRKRFHVCARKEVVLTAGAIHTPHILLLSGIGPANHLKSRGIDVVADLPGVGSYLKDHPVVDLHYKDASKSSLMYLKPRSFFESLLSMKALLQYFIFGNGALTTSLGEAIAFARTSDPTLFPPSQFSSESTPEDNGSAEGAPDLELFATPSVYLNHTRIDFTEPGHFFGLHAVLLRPKSHGKVMLKSSDPFEQPIVDPNYYSEPNDVKVLVRGVRLCARLARAEPLESLVDPTGDGCPQLHHNIGSMSDAHIAEDIRQRSETLYHPCCTARMAPLEDDGVVDPFLRVHKVKNLRIADASIFPEIISGHTTAPVLAIAEKAADMIKSA